MSREQSKSLHYIQQLDQTRCNGNWEQVPELVRKVRKHAPARACLTLTAEIEHAITQSTKTRPANPGAAQSSGLSKYIAPLIEVIDKEQTHVEDEFQARVCLAWLYWVLDDPTGVVARLPSSIIDDYSQLDGTGKESSTWTKVCAVKAAFIKGTSEAKTQSSIVCFDTFDAALPVLAGVPNLPGSGPELRKWTELYLTQFCLASSLGKVPPGRETQGLAAFRTWAGFWEGFSRQGSAPIGGRAPSAEVPRRLIWKEFYNVLSSILQQGSLHPLASLSSSQTGSSTKLQQRAELGRVATIYENLLLKEIPFPKADETSDEVEDWVNLVVQNWQILCGDRWQEEDLGEGGRDAVSHGVLDVLYRAATKTFHSTKVLRHLFTLHLAVAEFDLAFKAFDTYLDIVTKGKARVYKIGEPEQGLDDDETFIKTASSCIRALCRYGHSRGAVKARDLGEYLQSWLDKHYPHYDTGIKSDDSNENKRPGSGEGDATNLPLKALAGAWQAIGLSQANWARVTYDATTRSDLQSQAVKNLRRSLSQQYQSEDNVESLYALGILLAERRELNLAIDLIKGALLPTKLVERSDDAGPIMDNFSRERSLIPLWHLLALLLSARQDFTTAARFCEGAFEQFKDPAILFGELDGSPAYRSEHLNHNHDSSNGMMPEQSGGIIDLMDDFEKEAVLEVKMTQLVLIEVLEGPDVAVNASDELLSLYSRLFGAPLRSLSSVKPMPSTPRQPPKSSAATVRSIRGSIFGRSHRSRKSISSVVNSPSPLKESSSVPIRPQTSQTTTSAVTATPAIQVTGATENTSKQHRHLSLKNHSTQHHEKLRKRNGSLLKKRSTTSLRLDFKSDESNSTKDEAASNGGSKRPVFDHSATRYYTPPIDSAHRQEWLDEDPRMSQVGLAISPSEDDSREILAEPVDESAKGQIIENSNSKPIPPISQNLPQKEKELKGPTQGEYVQDSRLPHVSPYSSSTAPITRFPADQERRRRIAILVKVWLMIASFYRHASMHEDAGGAIDEAYKVLRELETDVSRDASGLVSITDSGWGGGKSVEELWGDVLSERGYLEVAKASPHKALSEFESALIHSADHPIAIVGISNILLDIYTKELAPPPAIPPLILPGNPPLTAPSTQSGQIKSIASMTGSAHTTTLIPTNLGPLGLPTASVGEAPLPSKAANELETSSTALDPPYKVSSTTLLDRLAARDRAFGLLNRLVKLGSGWSYSDAWFALARAYEEGGQIEKAREALWWCVELEDNKGVRAWGCVGVGGYVL